MSEGDIVQDFLVESYENLDRLDRDLVGLEKNPQDQDALAGIFRTIHTIKGTCGFLGFNRLEKVTHVGENLLTRLRDRQLTLTPEITTALLSMVDAVREMLSEIASSGQDGDSDYPELREVLTRLLTSPGEAAPTGEESYTLAMNLMEEAEGTLKGWTAEILATDLNDRSVEAAKAGIYGDYALRNTSDHYRRKYFTAMDDKKLQVRPEVKKMISFSRLNLLDDSRMLFMKGMDAIFCCNVLIYFDNTSKSRVVNHFFSNLNFGGYFFLGTSESLMKLNEQFHLVHFPGTIAYWKPSLKGGKL